MEGNAGRYAVYFAPEAASALARFGAAWLGYDAATGDSAAHPAVAGIDRRRWQAITAAPRQYGFHATLKPPFALAENADATALMAAVRALAGDIAAFAAPQLRLSWVSGFWALTLAEPCAAMDRLAALCVSELDRFRAPPSPEELAGRRRAGLSPSQEVLLTRWGYPYVMKEFRFHMTLTGRLDPDEGAAVGRLLARVAEPCCQAPLTVDAISLFGQDSRAARFRLLHRYRLTG
jgi:putative phosphonate metabolism protein